jgi:hypothetical protein
MAPLCAIALIGSGYPRMLDTNYYPVGWLQVMGRLKRGVSSNQARARLKELAPQIYQSAFEQQGLVREDGVSWGRKTRGRTWRRPSIRSLPATESPVCEENTARR